jgi:hypothetical protein
MLDPDPHLFNADPDPAFFLLPIRIKLRISRVLMTKNWKKFKAEKNLYLLTKIAIFLSLALYKRRPSYMKSLQPSKENIQQFKT